MRGSRPLTRPSLRDRKWREMVRKHKEFERRTPTACQLSFGWADGMPVANQQAAVASIVGGRLRGLYLQSLGPPWKD